MDRSIMGEPDNRHYAGTSSNFSDTRRCCLINIIQNFEGIFNLPSYPKDSTVVDVRELSGG
ncbi:hypothetical protein PVK06_012110 [Gossypium arboreum]|uniref:Uncharacterized protein n=1 Tax=Gossypium arboreum TaxID=29729 RepID=A0ABR0QAV8_GOSAR|nr:hypothetical protein PVK06_012110 [Gossypium arboreum]